MYNVDFFRVATTLNVLRNNNITFQKTSRGIRTFKCELKWRKKIFDTDRFDVGLKIACFLWTAFAKFLLHTYFYWTSSKIHHFLSARIWYSPISISFALQILYFLITVSILNCGTRTETKIHLRTTKGYPSSTFSFSSSNARRAKKTKNEPSTGIAANVTIQYVVVPHRIPKDLITQLSSYRYKASIYHIFWSKTP